MSTLIPQAYKHYSKIFLISFSFFCFIPYSHAGGYDHGASSEQAAQELPKNISLTQARHLKSRYERKLSNILGNSNKTTIDEEEFLLALLNYDDLCLEISDVLLQLIDEYQLDGDLAKKLAGFSKTFATRIREAQSQIHNLAEYKAYRNIFSLTYVALIYTLNDDQSFYQRYEIDLKDPKTTVGDYKQRLDIAYESLSKKHLSYLNLNKQRQLEQQISSLDTLISNRKLAHYSPITQP